MPLCGLHKSGWSVATCFSFVNRTTNGTSGSGSPCDEDSVAVDFLGYASQNRGS